MAQEEINEARRKWQRNTTESAYRAGLNRAEDEGRWDTGVREAQNEDRYREGVAQFLGVSTGEIRSTASTLWENGVSNARWSPSSDWANRFDQMTSGQAGEDAIDKWEQNYRSHFTQ